MIPLSLILWLMMQGQGCYESPEGNLNCPSMTWTDESTIPDGLMVTPQPIGSVITCYGRTDIGCANPNATSADHVIEIRTRRGPMIHVKSWHDCQALQHPVTGDDHGGYCYKWVTREIWIDGTRWGVLKETEAK